MQNTHILFTQFYKLTKELLDQLADWLLLFILLLYKGAMVFIRKEPKEYIMQDFSEFGNLTKNLLSKLKPWLQMFALLLLGASKKVIAIIKKEERLDLSYLKKLIKKCLNQLRDIFKLVFLLSNRTILAVKENKPDLFYLSQDEQEAHREEFSKKSKIILLFITIILFFPINNNISGIATVIPQEYVYVEAIESGIVSDVYFEEGDKVKKGDILIELYNADILSELEASYKEEIILQQELLKLKEEKKWHKKLLDRNTKLYDKDVIAAAEMELTRLKYRTAQLEIGIRNKKFDILKKRRRYLKEILEMTKIKSNIEGVIIGKLKDKLGTFMEKGDALCMVANTDKFLLELPVDEKKVRYAKIGQLVSVKFCAYPNKRHKGVLKDIRPVFWEKTQRLIVKNNVINVYIDFEKNNNQDLKIGMSAFVKIHTGKTTLFKKIFDGLNYIVSM